MFSEINKALKKQAAPLMEPVGQAASDTDELTSLNEEEGLVKYVYDESKMITLTMAAPCAYIMNDDFPNFSTKMKVLANYYKIMPPPSSQEIVIIFDSRFKIEQGEKLNNQYCKRNR